METNRLRPFPRRGRIKQTRHYDDTTGSSSEEEEEETYESSEDEEDTEDSASDLTVVAPSLDRSSKRKRKRVEADVVVEDEEGDNRAGERMMWEEAMVKLMKKKFDYVEEDYVRLQIASMSKSTRDLLVKRWFRLKVKMDKAAINLRCVENECLQALFRS